MVYLNLKTELSSYISYETVKQEVAEELNITEYLSKLSQN